MSTEKPSSDFVLRLIAIYKLAHAVLFLAAAVGVLHLLNKDLETTMQNALNHLHVDSDNKIADWCLRQAGMVTNFKLESLSAVFLLYGLLFGTEGVGLYLKKRWAEYLVIVITGSLLPVEGYELWHSVNWFKIVIIIGNLGILGYLIHVVTTKNKAKKA